MFSESSSGLTDSSFLNIFGCDVVPPEDLQTNSDTRFSLSKILRLRNKKSSFMRTFVKIWTSQWQKILIFTTCSSHPDKRQPSQSAVCVKDEFNPDNEMAFIAQCTGKNGGILREMNPAACGV